MTSPILSIVTIALKENRDLIRCIESCNFKNIEVQHIVVLSDLKNKLKSKFFKKNLYIYKDNKKGVYGAINIGLEKVKGEFILVLHGDNYLTKKAPKLIEKLLVRKQSIQFGCYQLNSKNKLKNFLNPRLNFLNLILGLYPPHPGLLLYYGDFEKIGFYDTNYKICSDFDYYIKIHKHRIKFFSNMTNIIISPVGGISTSGINSVIKIFKERKIILNKHFENAKIIFPVTIFIGYIIKSFYRILSKS